MSSSCHPLVTHREETANLTGTVDAVSMGFELKIDLNNLAIKTGDPPDFGPDPLG